METLLQDIRYGLRMLRKAPAFAAIAITTLALGMGANTVVFSILNTLFFRPAPVSHPAELVMTDNIRGGISPANYFFDRDHSRSLAGVAAEHPTVHLFMVSGGESKMVLGAIVSANYFDLLGIRAFAGRYFVKEEDSPVGQTSVAVLSYDLWRSAFGADPGVLGRTIKLNNVETVIVGIAAPGFHGLHAGIDNDLWVPTAGAAAVSGYCEPQQPAECGFFANLVARLRTGAGMEGAQSELQLLNQEWESLHPDPALEKNEIALFPVRGLYPGQSERGEISQAAKLLPLSVAVLLIIACSNVAGLLLARGASRTREIAVRLALGASRGRIVRQLLTEAAILAALGSALGLLFLQETRGWLTRFPFIGTEGFKSYYDVSLNPLVMASTVALSALTVIVFGLAPAVRTSAPAPGAALKAAELTSTPRSRLRGMLVSAQVALAFVLLAGATLLVRSLDHLLLGPGFDSGHIAIVRVSPYRLAYSPSKSEKFQREALTAVSVLPGVKSASLGQLMPWWESWDDWICLPGHEPARKEDRRFAKYNSIGPGFLQTLQIPILRGREFNDGDRKNAPRVVIVNQTLATRMWPSREPVGETLLIGGVAHRVVGVSEDAQYNPASIGAHPFFYLPYWQVRDGGDARFMVRTQGNPSAALPQIKAAIAKLDPAVPVGEDTTMREGLLGDFGPLRLTRAVLIFAGLAALFLSAIGLYGVLAFVVERRTREIGIRMALGATREGVLSVFLRNGMMIAAAGTSFGCLAAIASTQLLATMLYGVSARDPWIFSGVAAVLVGACLAASYFPARRASKVDPMVALRYE